MVCAEQMLGSTAETTKLRVLLLVLGSHYLGYIFQFATLDRAEYRKDLGIRGVVSRDQVGKLYKFVFSWSSLIEVLWSCGCCLWASVIIEARILDSGGCSDLLLGLGFFSNTLFFSPQSLCWRKALNPTQRLFLRCNMHVYMYTLKYNTNTIAQL